MTDYAELRAALNALKPNDGDAMLAYRLASGPEVIRALLAERDALAEAVDCLHAFAGRVAPSASFWDDTWPKLDAAIARAALAQGEA